MLARQLIAEGMDTEEAYHQAIHRFGLMKAIRRDAHRAKSAHVRGYILKSANRSSSASICAFNFF